jgi:hypothetical protein
MIEQLFKEGKKKHIEEMILQSDSIKMKEVTINPRTIFLNNYKEIQKNKLKSQQSY